MELALMLAAFLCFHAGFPFAALILRCGLSACLRFSPRAAVALASVAGLAGYAAALLFRHPLRAVLPGRRSAVILAGITGGTAGRMLLLMFTARFSGSLALLRLQAVPLVLLAALILLARRRLSLPQTRAGLYFLSLLGGILEGFLGCGGTIPFFILKPEGVQRRPDALPAPALLLAVFSQASALTLTLFSGGAQVFPVRMLVCLSLGAALGALVFEKTKQRGEVHRGLRAALRIYMLFAALAGIEQALLD